MSDPADPGPNRRDLLAGAAGALLLPAANDAAAAEATADPLHAFAFQTGHWRVRHRKLKARLKGSTEWHEFEGLCDAVELLGGAGNVDDHWLDDPNGAYRAATFRRYDASRKSWSIWWFDQRSSELGPPVHGNFDKGVGTFLGDDMLDGRPIRMRFIWSAISASHARWEQAFSADAGASWETNWIMAFDRLAWD